MKKTLCAILAAVICLLSLLPASTVLAESTHVYDPDQIVSLAKQQYGKPYSKGTQGKNSFDCIGLVRYVFGKYGIDISFTTSAFNRNRLSKIGVKIARKDLKPGDVVCFGSEKNITHVGIYIGNGIMINAMNEKYGVKYSFIDRKAYTAGTKSGKSVTIDGTDYTFGYFSKPFCYGVRIYGAEFSSVTVNETECILKKGVSEPSVRATFGSAVLKEGTDYTLRYRNNTAPGTGTVILTGKGHYKGVSAEKQFEIAASGNSVKHDEPGAKAKIELVNPILPSGTLAKGRPFTVGGTLVSDAPITGVEFAVMNESGDTVFCGNARLDSKKVPLYCMDKELTFSKLPEGKYFYRLSAGTDTSGEVWEGTFQIRQSDVKGSQMTYPKGDLKQGNSFCCKGTVQSSSRIQKVTLSVCSTDGTRQFSVSANPDTNRFSVYQLDAKMTFRKLAKGTYIYRVAVTDSNGTVSYLISTSFRVTGK